MSSRGSGTIRGAYAGVEGLDYLKMVSIRASLWLKEGGHSSLCTRSVPTARLWKTGQFWILFGLVSGADAELIARLPVGVRYG